MFKQWSEGDGLARLLIRVRVASGELNEVGTTKNLTLKPCVFYSWSYKAKYYGNITSNIK